MRTRVGGNMKNSNRVKEDKTGEQQDLNHVRHKRRIPGG